MRELNDLLVAKDSNGAWKFLTEFTKERKKTKNVLKKPQPQTEAVQDPADVREIGILQRFIKQKQLKLELPLKIPAEYKMKLLLPLALHENSLHKLHRLQLQLAKGPPKTYLNYTSAGRSRIWFLRSALNKGKMQSKSLGRLIRREKKMGQNNLNYSKACQENSIWAWHEAVWEHFLENDEILKGGPPLFLNRIENSDQENSIVADSKKRFTEDQQASLTSKYAIEWLSPIKECLEILHEGSRQRVKYFEDYRKKFLINDGIKFLSQKSDQMYYKRLARYDKMAEEDLPYVTPFFQSMDLPTVLKNRKFVK